MCCCVLIAVTEVVLTRFAIQAKGPDGKWTRKPLAYRESNNVHLLIARPPVLVISSDKPIIRKLKENIGENG